MKTKKVVLDAILFAAAAVLLAFTLVEARQEMSGQDQKMMEQMMKYGTPVAEHELLKKYVGEWDAAITMWQDPMGQPQKSQGTLKGQLIFDGRYVKCEFEGMMGGMSSKGLEIVGYDLFKKMYTTFWIDSWSTSFMTTTGTLDKSGKALIETGMFPDPMTDGKMMQKVKNVTTFVADGKIKFEMFMVMPDGKEAKSMEMVYTRKAAM